MCGDLQCGDADACSAVRRTAHPRDTLIEDEGAHIRFTLPKDTVERGQDALQALKLHFSELEQNYSDFLNVMEVHTDAED